MMESNHRHHNSEPPATHPLLPSDSHKVKETAIIVDNNTPSKDSKPSNNDKVDEKENEEEEEESYEDRLKNSDMAGRAVLRLQSCVKTVVRVINDRCRGYLFPVICIILYLVYFFYAMFYKFGDEGSVRLLWMTVLGAFIAGRHKIYWLMDKTPCVRWWKNPKPDHTVQRINTLRFFTRWLLYGGVGAFMGYTIIDVALKDSSKLRSLPGIFVFMLVCFLFSRHPSKVNWHTIYWSMGLQFVLAVLVMRWQGGKEAVLWIQARLDSFFANSKPASILLFGESYQDHHVIFGAFPIIFLTNAMLSILYYLGAMQFLVNAIGSALRFVLGTTAIESTGVAASIFMEGATAMLALRPYLDKMTNSELFALTTACLASIGGAFLAILAQLGIPVEFMLPAMVISAPATFAVCKLVVPETREPKKIVFGGELPPEMRHSSLLEAAQAGAVSVVSLVANVLVVAFAFFSLISFTNNIFVWFGDRVGIEQLTMEKLLSYICYPFALLMGVDLEDCRQVGLLMGLRMTSSNFVSLLKMAEMVGNRMKLEKYWLLPNATVTYVGDHVVLDQWNMTLVDGFISRRSEAIATYALCGFSGILSLFITVSILATLVPQRQKWLTSMAIPLLIAGNFANFMVGCFAGVLL